MIRTSPFKLSTCRNWKECKAAAIMLGASLSLIPTYSTSELTRKDVAPSRTPFARFVPVRSCSLSFFFHSLSNRSRQTNALCATRLVHMQSVLRKNRKATKALLRGVYAVTMRTCQVLVVALLSQWTFRRLRTLVAWHAHAV